MSRERIVSPDDLPEEGGKSGGEGEWNWGLRPKSLAEYTGQRDTVERLKIAIDASKARAETLDHLLLSGPPGLGKCITGDSLIQTADRGLVPFSQLLPPDMKAGASAPACVTVWGVDGPERATHFYFSGRVPTRRIRTRSGFELEGTPHHPVLVSSPSGPTWKTLGELTPNDYVAVARGMNAWGRPKSATYRPDAPRDRRAASERCARRLHAELGRVLERTTNTREMRAGWAQIHRSGESPAAQLTARRLGLPPDNGRLFASRANLDLKSPAARNRTRSVALNGNMGYLLGVLIGAGHVEKGASCPAFVITCDEAEMQRELTRVSERVFGHAPLVKRCGDKTARMKWPKSCGQVCADFGVRAVNAAHKRVPAAILAGPRAAAIGFLQGLFDADGRARADGIELGVRSKWLCREVQIMLANLGVIASLREKTVEGEPFWMLWMGGANAEHFLREVGFRLTRKQNAWVPTANAGWTRSELVPDANAALCAVLEAHGPQSRATHRAFDHVKRDDRTPSRARIEKLLDLLPIEAMLHPAAETLRALCDPRICWERVADIAESENETWDFVVPGTRSFVANGIYNHNTSLAYIVAEELGRDIALTSGPALERPGDVMGFLVNAKEGDIIFIDEIHRLPRIVEEFLYSAMEDYIVNFTLDKGMYSKPLPIRLEKFTIIGATTRPAMLTRPLRDRFGLQQHFDFYTEEDLVSIVRRSAHILQTDIDQKGAFEIARRSRGTPRVANRLLRRVRDYALVRADGDISLDVAREALKLEGIDELGLDRLDHAVLSIIKDVYDGGPVGIEALAATLNEESDTLVDVVEPYLLKIGFLARTPAGRRITRRAYEYLGEPAPPSAFSAQMTLLEEAEESEERLREIKRLRKRDGK